LHKPEIGVSCAGVAALSGASIDTYRTYWLPESDVAAIKDQSFNLFDAANDEKEVVSNTLGLLTYKLGTSGNQFQADKFILVEQDSYSNLRDYHF